MWQSVLYQFKQCGPSCRCTCTSLLIMPSQKKRNGEFRVDVEIKPIKENMARLSKIDPNPHHHPISKLLDQERVQVDPNGRTQN